MRWVRVMARRLGYRSLVYLAFVMLLIPLERAMNQGVAEPEDGGGLGLVLGLWLVVSLLFFLGNAVLALVAAARGRPIAIPMIACVLPVICLLAAAGARSGL
jgi:hypothetical protein